MLKTTRVWTACIAILAALAICLNGGAAWAQKEKPKKVKDRVEDLETRVERIDNTLGDLTGSEKPEKIRERQDELADKIDDASAQIDELKNYSEDVGVATEERDARIDALSEEIEDLWKEVEEHKATIKELKETKTTGYDGGFFMASRDGKHKIVFTGLVKPYYRVGFQKVYDTDSYGAIQYYEPGHPKANYPIGGDTEITDNGFGLAAMRLTVSAQVFDIVKFKLQIDYGNLYGKVSYPSAANVDEDTQYNRVEIETYSLRAVVAYGELAPMREINVRAGQFKVPFDQESLFGTRELTFTSRSLMNRSYARWGENVLPPDSVTMGWDYDTNRGASFGYDRGMMIHGAFTENIFKYNVGVFNGNGPNVGNDNRDILVALRVESQFLGEMTPGMSDLDSVKKPLMSIGAAFAYDLPMHKDLIEPEFTYNSQDVNFTADIRFKWYGVSLFTNMFFRNSNHGAVLLDELDQERPIKTFGYTGQLAYFNLASGLEPAFRYSMMDADTDRLGDHVHEFAAALNYYIVGNNLKIQVEWSGMFASEKNHSYMVPWEAWFEDQHQITIMAQAAF